MIKDHPLSGTGPGTFSLVFTQYQPPGYSKRYYYSHNDYLHFISVTGLIMTIGILWIIITFYKTGFENIKNSTTPLKGISLGAMMGITAILIHSISDFNLHIPPNAVLFTILSSFSVFSRI